MPLNLEPGDRGILMGAAIALAALLAAMVVLTPPAASGPAVPSSWSVNSRGGKAAFELLRASGYAVERWSNPPTALPSAARGTALILADPFFAVTASEADRQALARFLAAGGWILATGPVVRLLLPDLPRPSENQPFAVWQSFGALEWGRLTEGASRITLPPQIRWRAEGLNSVPLYGNGGGAVALWVPRGAGAVVWWADAAPLTNAGIAQPGNMELLLNSLGGAHTILWDEYFHGARPQSGGLLADLGATPWALALWPLAALLLATLWTEARRSGPVRSRAPKRRDEPLEFVEGLGHLFARARAAGVAIEIARQALAREASPGDVEARQLLAESWSPSGEPTSETAALGQFQRLQAARLARRAASERAAWLHRR